MRPLISIVIANYNYGCFLAAAIESILHQSDDRVELLVVDGGSTDDSVDIIKRYSDRIAWWVSEKDNGQSDAFNKGFAHARGKYLTWLNADDVLLPGAIESVLQEIVRHPDSQWFAGATIYFTDSGIIKTATVPLGNFLPRLLRVPAWMRVSGPSSFFSRELLSEAGDIRLDLRYVMDIDLWMRFFNLGAKIRIINQYIWGFRVHDESKTSSSITTGQIDSRFAKERLLIRKTNRVDNFSERLQLLMKRVCAVLSFGYVRRYMFMRRTPRVPV